MSNRDWLVNLVRSVLKSDEQPLPVQWIDDGNLVLDGEVVLKGQMSTRDFAFQRSFINAWADEGITDLAVMGAPQVSKSGGAMAGLAWSLKYRPRDVLWMLSTIPNARSFSENRWKTTLRASPALSVLIPADSDKMKNLEQALIGSVVTFTGSNSLGNVSQRTKEIVVIDELDKVEDPAMITQADARAFSAASPKRVKISEPIFEDGPIDRAWRMGDKREWHICCARCGDHFLPDLHLIRYSKDAVRGDEIDTALVEASAELVCPLCKQPNTESSRLASIREGIEVKTAVPAAGHASWRWPAWLAPWPSASWGKLKAAELVMLRAGNAGDVENKIRAMPRKFSGEKLDPKGLREKTYTFTGYPLDGYLLTFGGDVQGDRIELQFVLWGDEGKAWQVEYATVHGDPELESTWDEVADVLFKVKRPVPLAGGFIDSGGHHTEMVYRFCEAFKARKIFACRGSPHPGKPIVTRPRRTKKYGVKLYSIGTENAKVAVVSSFRQEAGKPGSVLFREDMDDEYFKQLASEELRTTYRNGAPVKRWFQVYERNEALDTWVYALAFKTLLGSDRAVAIAKAKVLAARAAGKPEPEETTAPAAKRRVLVPRRTPRRAGWVNNF